VEHELNAAGEIDTETPPIRGQIVAMHQRSPGGMHGQMETHWEENNGPASRYFNKHFTRSVIFRIVQLCALIIMLRKLLMLMLLKKLIFLEYNILC